MTVLEVIQRSAGFLARKGVDSPRLQIELLLAHVLQMPRLKLYLSFERVLSDTELATLRDLVRRRGHREPLQHLLGTVSFCGFELAVNRQVLIPRPETELLAERAWSFLAAGSPPAPTVLDFGTGSGCLAVVLAAKCPGARVCAVDLSPAALEVARANAVRHGVGDRIAFLCGDGFAPLPAEARFNLIVANPPYIPAAGIEALQPEVRDHDPRLALDGGPDGLAFMRRLANEAPARLAAAGRLMVEFGDGQAEAVAGLFAATGWQVEPAVRDWNDRPRMVVAWRE